MNEEKHKNKSVIDDKIKDLENLVKQLEGELAECKNSTNFKLLERIVVLEQEVRSLTNDLIDLKDSFDVKLKDFNEINLQFQEIAGSVNQLKLSIDEIHQKEEKVKEQKTNIFWQLVIPIILALIFFFVGLFFKSVSSLNEKPLDPVYINFENK